MAQLTWSPEALRDLDEICSFLGRTSDSYARAVASDARAVAESLPAMPRLGAKVPDYDRDDIRERQVRNFRLIYRIHGEDVEVVSFVNASQRLPRTPPG